jgi:glycerol-3-phosphate dehydrogenase
MVLMVIPTPFLRRFIAANREKFPENVPLVCCSKGIEKVWRDMNPMANPCCASLHKSGCNFGEHDFRTTQD